MKSLFLLFASILIIQAAHGQTLQGDSVYISKDGDRFQVNDKILCGSGTLPNGDFKWIYTSPTSIAGKINIAATYSGLNLTIKKVKKMGSEKMGYKYYFIVGGGNIANYTVEIEQALASGEIEKPK